MSDSASTERDSTPSSLDPHVGVVMVLAEVTVARLARRVIRQLRRLEHTLSGEDSGLRNVWEEVCVQVQFEESIFWGSYQDLIDDFIGRALSEVPRHELEALWLQSYEGERWWSDEANWGEGPIPCFEGDVVQQIRGAVYGAAADWSNPRIRAHIERSYRAD